MQIKAAMTRPLQRNATDNGNLNVTEKISIIYFGLRVARDHVFCTIDQALHRRKIAADFGKYWKGFFENEFASCLKMRLKTYRDCALLEFRVRHLMNAAENLDFDNKKSWQGYTISLENIFFPVMEQ